MEAHLLEKLIDVKDADFERELFGDFDKKVKIIEEKLKVTITQRNSALVLMGENEENLKLAENTIEQLFNIYKKSGSIDEHTVKYCIDVISDDISCDVGKLGDDIITLTAKGNAVRAKTLGQKKYINDIESNDVTICIGPAGTGKTYLAVAMAVKAFKEGMVNRIILTRPAVEAGESLGFLPGDLKDKVDPYLRPLYDALFEMFGAEKFEKHLEMGTIEVAPLAFMRGRTLDNSFIILDEAQNTTKEQMKMFLTRFGYGSKVVVTGDITQIDLVGENKKSGLIHASSILKGVKGIAIDQLTMKDVVRHELVQRIIERYDFYEKATTKKPISVPKKVLKK